MTLTTGLRWCSWLVGRSPLFILFLLCILLRSILADWLTTRGSPHNLLTVLRWSSTNCWWRIVVDSHCKTLTDWMSDNMLTSGWFLAVELNVCVCLRVLCWYDGWKISIRIDWGWAIMTLLLSGHWIDWQRIVCVWCVFIYYAVCLIKWMDDAHYLLTLAAAVWLHLGATILSSSQTTTVLSAIISLQCEVLFISAIRH